MCREPTPSSTTRRCRWWEEMIHGIPEGCIVHIESPTDDGYRVTEVWESEEAWQGVPQRDTHTASATGHRGGVPSTTRPTNLSGALCASAINRIAQDAGGLQLRRRFTG
jgi:hypothetical protein